MVNPWQVRLPRQWTKHINSGVLHAISLATVVPTYTRSRATGYRRLQAELDQARAEIALLREELRMAHVLARAGLCLGATTIRRMIREIGGSTPGNREEESIVRRRRVIARYPGHILHVDLTTVPTGTGFCVFWFPFSLPQRWPFSWWLSDRSADRRGGAA